MSKFSRDKGVRNERKIVNIFRDNGFHCRRVPLSGGTEYAKGDIELWPKDSIYKRVCEVKSGKSLPTKQIRSWLAGSDPKKPNDILVLDETNKPILVCMTLETMLELL